MDINNLDYILDKYPYLGTRSTSYQIESLRILEDGITPVRGLDILEIGGALPAELTIDQLGANSWTCVEKMDYWEQGNQSVHKSRLKQIKSNHPGWMHHNACIFDWLDGIENSYDIIFSCCAFEHIGNIKELLDDCYRSLRKGGILYSYFLPVYSAFNGHHCPDYYSRGELVAQAKFSPFCHLLYSPSELMNYLRSIYNNEVSDFFHHKIIEDPHINRMMYDDYISLIDKSMFSIKQFHGLLPKDLDSRLLSALNERRGSYSYQYSGICFALIK